MQKKMIVTQLLKPTIKLKRQRPTNHTGNKLLWKESSYTLQTVALGGRYKPESCSTFDGRGQLHQSESEILVYSSRCIKSPLEKSACGAFLEDPWTDSILCDQKRSSFSAFHYTFVQCKRKTTYQNATFIPISLRCNPFSSDSSGPHIPLNSFLAPFQLSFSSLRFVPQLPLQAANIGKALQFLRKVIFVEDRVSTMLHHFERHGPKDRGKLIDAFRSGEREKQRH